MDPRVPLGLCQLWLLPEGSYIFSNFVSVGLEVVCDKCELRWCFPCHGPWHEGLSCKDYRKGDRLLQMWALEMKSGQVNAQRCPRCKIFIQRTSGCDHMTCSSCKTSFCYRCGKRYRSLKMFGNHFSRYSLFGCKYNLLPQRPGARRFVRGAVFGMYSFSCGLGLI
ncbi:hypothetical protein LOTGIDRAFT_138098 [Lottia gigantea]|uniref:RBR-type E3 ubiquitin transferase n=1 Tax=Lottia gigantea TaxID=225164 RepID=V4BA32_LOTGI|nr:hypothetical protein LOTGIDRAFT_138098 [Lottia gigantea]ESP02642.1 hypothetical protein LOTGIDRAFT_138098 [Lottia gigantea]